MGDLLSQGLGSKEKGGGESSTPPETDSAKGTGIIGNTTHDEKGVGEDLLASVGTVDEKETKSEVETKDNSVSSKEDSSDTVRNPDTWTKESALKEVKKAREEAKAHRLKYQEMVKDIENQTKEKLAEQEAKYKEALKAKKKLEEMEKQEADKKRSLEEKVQHRDKELADAQARVDAIEQTYKEQLEAAQSQIKELTAEREAQMKVYQEKLDEELASIPEEKKDIASLLVKGAGDARDALIALNEAKLKGVFEDKKVVVSHQVPGAKSGARVTQDQLDAAEKERRSKLSPQQLIKEGLKGAGRASTPKMNKNSIL